MGPDGDYSIFDFANARFIWTDDLDLDNTVIFRYKAEAPPGYRKRWNADGDLNITDIVGEARLDRLTSPQLFQVNANRLATGYVTRVRGAQQSTEQLAASSQGTTAAVPIDLGPAGDQVYLILYGGNLGTAASAGATIGGVPAEVAYAGPLTPANGVAQFNILIPRSLAGAGTVDIVVTINGQSSNAVTVNIR